MNSSHITKLYSIGSYIRDTSCVAAARVSRLIDDLPKCKFMGRQVTVLPAVLAMGVTLSVLYFAVKYLKKTDKPAEDQINDGQNPINNNTDPVNNEDDADLLHSDSDSDDPRDASQSERKSQPWLLPTRNRNQPRVVISSARSKPAPQSPSEEEQTRELPIIRNSTDITKISDEAPSSNNPLVSKGFRRNLEEAYQRRSLGEKSAPPSAEAYESISFRNSTNISKSSDDRDESDGPMVSEQFRNKLEQFYKPRPLPEKKEEAKSEENEDVFAEILNHTNEPTPIHNDLSNQNIIINNISMNIFDDYDSTQSIVPKPKEQSISQSYVLHVNKSTKPRAEMNYIPHLKGFSKRAQVNMALKNYPSEHTVTLKKSNKSEEFTFLDDSKESHTINVRPVPEGFEQGFEVSLRGEVFQGEKWREKLAVTLMKSGLSLDATRQTLNVISRTGTLGYVHDASNSQLNAHLPKGLDGIHLTSHPSRKVNVDISVEDGQVAVKHTVYHQLSVREGNKENVTLPLESRATITSIVSEGETENEVVTADFEAFQAIVSEPSDILIEESPDLESVDFGSDNKISQEPAEAQVAPKVVTGKRSWSDWLKNLTTRSAHAALEAKYTLSLEAAGVPITNEPIREQYANFMVKLREQLLAGAGCLKTVYDRFMKNKNYTYLDQLVHAVISSGLSNLGKNIENGVRLIDLSWEEQIKAIQNMNTDLDANRLAVAISNLGQYFGLWADPHKKTNVPYASYDLRLGNKTVCALRIGTPTEQGVEQTSWLIFRRYTRLIPEFLAFLQYKLQKNLGGHLYVSFQDRNSKWKGDESPRTEVIEGMASDKDLKDIAFVATLSQDSSFYTQTREGDEKDIATEAFINDFMNQMNRGGDSGFFFSANLKMDSAENRNRLHKALTDTRDMLYPHEAKLSTDQRRIFIEVAYALITLQLLIISGATTFNLTCKDAIDRAGKTNSILFYVLMMMTGKTEDEEMRRQHMVMTHAPALIVKKQSIIGSRLRRFLETIAVLRPEDKAMRDALNARFAALAKEYGVESPPKVCNNGKGFIEDDFSKPIRQEMIIQEKPLVPPAALEYARVRINNALQDQATTDSHFFIKLRGELLNEFQVSVPMIDLEKATIKEALKIGKEHPQIASKIGQENPQIEVLKARYKDQLEEISKELAQERGLEAKAMNGVMWISDLPKVQTWVESYIRAYIRKGEFKPASVSRDGKIESGFWETLSAKQCVPTRNVRTIEALRASTRDHLTGNNSHAFPPLNEEHPHQTSWVVF